MPENKVISLEERAKDEEKPFLEQLLQEGARKLLQAAIENEVIDYIQFHKDRRDEDGQRLVVRNGHLPEREIVSGIGPIKVRQPRVRHRDQGRFTSAIQPRFMRRTPSAEARLGILEFAQSVLGIELYPWQRETLLHIQCGHPTALVACNGAGKTSTVFVTAALWALFNWPRARIIVTSANLSL